MRTVISVLCLGFLCAQQGLQAHGKIDVGPVGATLEVLENNVVVDRMHVGGVRADATIQVVHGFCLNPNFLIATGDGDFLATGLGAGYYIPLKYGWAVMPTVGIGYSALETTIDLSSFGIPFDVDERFHSWTPYVSLQFSFQPCQQWRFTGTVQYGWSRTETTLSARDFGTIVRAKESTQGWNYALMADYYLTKCWSVNIGAAYNLMLSKEKHGIRAAGMRIGVGYTY